VTTPRRFPAGGFDAKPEYQPSSSVCQMSTLAAGQRRAVGARDLTGQDHRRAGLVVAHRQRGRRVELDLPVEPERAEDGADGAVLGLRGDLLDLELEVDVEEQRPLAGVGDADQPALERVELLVGHLVLADRGADPLERSADHRRRPLLVDTAAPRAEGGRARSRDIGGVGAGGHGIGHGLVFGGGHADSFVVAAVYSWTQALASR
jgi:hypothetical protein